LVLHQIGVRALLAAVVLVAPSCAAPSSAQPIPAQEVAAPQLVAEPAPAPAPAEPVAAPWPPEATPHAAGPGVFDYAVAERRRHDGEPYLLHRFRVPLARARIDVVDARMRTDLDRVLRTRRAALVINGGYYGTDGRPEGLVIARGRRLNPLLPRIRGGVVAVLRGGRAVHEPIGGLTLPRGVEFAIQCSPQLVVQGRSAVDHVGENTASRTALCLRDGGRGLDVYVARVDPSRGRAGPTLHTFARELVAEGCEEALNLDGGPSTGVAWRAPEGPRALLPRRGVRQAITFEVQ
jgi:hypothetical protein